MEDFNNIEFDPIPEGLEFNESYMQDAFSLYDAEKEKRRKRILVWWFTSSLGFSCILLGVIYFFTKDTSNASTSKETAEKVITSTHRIDTKHNTLQQVQNGKSHLVTHKNGLHTPTENPVNLIPKERFSQSANTGTHSNALKDQKRVTNTLTSTLIAVEHVRKTFSISTLTIDKRNDESVEITDDTEYLSSYPVNSDVQNEKTKIDSGMYATPNNLLARSASLAFISDSIKLVIDSLKITSNTKTPPVSKHQLFINLGVNTLFGVKEFQNRMLFKEAIGLSYHYQLSKKIRVGVGLEYHSLPLVSYRRLISDTTKSDKKTIILNKTTLNYISLYPQASYQIGNKHQVTAGVGIEYLLVDPGERYEIKVYTDETPKRANSKLYYSTFNRFNFSISVGYVYQFSRFMSVQALYHYGFTDITKSNGLNQTFDRNSRLQLGLKIKLL